MNHSSILIKLNIREIILTRIHCVWVATKEILCEGQAEHVGPHDSTSIKLSYMIRQPLGVWRIPFYNLRGKEGFNSLLAQKKKRAYSSCHCCEPTTFPQGSSAIFVTWFCHRNILFHILRNKTTKALLCYKCVGRDFYICSVLKA